MVLSEIGVLWLWFLLVAEIVLTFANTMGGPEPGPWRLLWRNLRELSSEIWSMWRSRGRETEPIDRFVDGLLSRLLRSGLKCAWARVGPKGSDHRIEFKKYIRKAGDFGIELVLPRYAWAEIYFPKVRDYCEAKDIPFRIEPDRTKRPRDVLHVDCGRDLETAVKLTCNIWTEIFGLAEDAPRRFRASNISPFGELIDRPDQEMMSMSEGWRYVHRDMENPPPEPGGCGTSLWVIGKPVVLFGVLVAALFSQGAEPEWTLHIAGLSLGGSTESLVFLWLFLFYVTLRRLIDRRLRIEPVPINLPWLRKIIRPWRWLLRITVPIAVVLVWAGP